jgi:hypothetical protein
MFCSQAGNNPSRYLTDLSTIGVLIYYNTLYFSGIWPFQNIVYTVQILSLIIIVRFLNGLYKGGAHRGGYRGILTFNSFPDHFIHNLVRHPVNC